MSISPYSYMPCNSTWTCLFCCIALIRVTAKLNKDIKKDNIKNSLKTKNDFIALPNGAKGSPDPQ